jgi:hypothetical protein
MEIHVDLENIVNKSVAERMGFSLDGDGFHWRQGYEESTGRKIGTGGWVAKEKVEEAVTNYSNLPEPIQNRYDGSVLLALVQQSAKGIPKSDPSDYAMLDTIGRTLENPQDSAEFLLAYFRHNSVLGRHGKSAETPYQFVVQQISDAESESRWMKNEVQKLAEEKPEEALRTAFAAYELDERISPIKERFAEYGQHTLAKIGYQPAITVNSVKQLTH